MRDYDELIAQLLQQRDAYKRVGALVDGAVLLDEILHELANARAAESSTVLTLQSAAQVSGYSVEHLARMIRQGRIPNAGRLHAPRILAADLPRRPKRFDGSSNRSYDVKTDARALRSR